MPKHRTETTHVCVYMTGTDADEGVFEIGRRQRAKGALSIGYHYVIRRDGTVELGRPVDEIGLHDKKLNKVSIAIMVCGVSIAPQQTVALSEVIGVLKHEYSNDLVITQRTSGAT